MMSRVPDQRAADLLEFDRTKRPAHLLLWNRTAVAEPCLIRTQRKLPAGGGYQRSQRPARRLIGGYQARHSSPIRRSKQDCRVRGRRPPHDDMREDGVRSAAQMLRNTSEWGRVHGGESGSAAEQRVPHALGVARNDATGGGGASARLTRFRRGTRWRSGNGPRHH